MWNTITESRPTSRRELAAWYSSILEEQERSCLSVAEAAERVGITVATLYHWRRRLSSPARAARKPTEPGLVEVRVRGTDARSSVESRQTFVLRLGRSRAIDVPAGFDADDLGRLIEVVTAC